METNLQQRIDTMKAGRPQRRIERWCQDEARLGRKPIVRKVGALRSQHPVAHNHTRYEWLYVYGLVRPTTRQTYWLILPTVNTAAMNLALAEFARHVGAGPFKHILLVVDNARWHTSKQLVLPPGIELVYLPPARPELQPAERLWPFVRQAVANRTFPSLASWQDSLVERCLLLRAQPQVIHGATNYHWRPTI